VQRAIEEIVANVDDALDLETLAAGAGLSPFHFHRMFRGMVGETPLELARRLRMERAARQVLANNQPITQIAFDAGYETHESFTRAFRVVYRAPPSGFRHESTLEPRFPRRAPCISATARRSSFPEIQEAGRWQSRSRKCRSCASRR
jgi:AraC family transcriptional regulator